MSFIDMAFLKKSDLKNGYVTYRRRKTGQQLIIEWTKEMQMILDKYSEKKATTYFQLSEIPDSMNDAPTATPAITLTTT